MTLTGAANTEERCVFQGTKGRIIIDPYRLLVFTPEQLSEVEYHTLGRASAHTSDGKL